MALQLFERQHANYRPVIPQITVGCHGDIYLNAALMDEVGDWKNAHLYFDSDENRLAIKFVREADTNTFHLCKRKGRRSAKISAASFFKCFNIAQGERKVYRARHLPDKRIATCVIDGVGK